ncbi:uncharacterized protein LOC123967495 [Micropterus dolomieu]|uniref:uncharacterized protein LOC123967495 n=1 Tax=Micropterus dolomieu TaxID=147949 RepID=UPI001E8D535F|nr:uncharacterized protein LOC123967495 [Micropterus dolomieu]
MMISRMLQQQKALTQVLSADKKARHLIPTWKDIDVLESVSKSLGQLLNFTDALSGVDYVSVSCVKPVLHLFNTSILLMQEEDTDLTKKLKNEMLDYINVKYEDESTQELLDMTSCLDPRFKMDVINADNKAQVTARVASEMMGCQETPSWSTEVEPKDPDTSQTKKAKKSLGSFFKQSGAAVKGDSSLTLKNAVEAELNNYLLTRFIERGRSTCMVENSQLAFHDLPSLPASICAFLLQAPPQRGFSVQVATSSLVNALVSSLQWWTDWYSWQKTSA